MNIIGNGGVIAPNAPSASTTEHESVREANADTTTEAADSQAVSVDHQVGTVAISEIELPIRFPFASSALTQAHFDGKTPAEIDALIHEFHLRVFAAMEKTTSFHLLREVFYQVLMDAYQDVKAQDESGASAVKLSCKIDNIAFPKVEPQAGSFFVSNQTRIISPPPSAEDIAGAKDANGNETANGTVSQPNDESAGDERTSDERTSDERSDENPQTAEQLTADGGDAESSTPGESIDATAPSEGTTSAPEAVN